MPLPNMKLPSAATLKKVDVTRIVCDHVLSKSHTPMHRRFCGFLVIIGGVLISKIATPYVVLHIMFDAVGYFIHALWAVPFLEWLVQQFED